MSIFLGGLPNFPLAARLSGIQERQKGLKNRPSGIDSANFCSGIVLGMLVLSSRRRLLRLDCCSWSTIVAASIFFSRIFWILDHMYINPSEVKNQQVRLCLICQQRLHRSNDSYLGAGRLAFCSGMFEVGRDTWIQLTAWRA